MDEWRPGLCSTPTLCRGSSSGTSSLGQAWGVVPWPSESLLLLLQRASIFLFATLSSHSLGSGGKACCGVAFGVVVFSLYLAQCPLGLGYHVISSAIPCFFR